MKQILSAILINLFVLSRTKIEGMEYIFPDDFLLGAATSSYQVEGAWNESGKGRSEWDRLSHEGFTIDGSNGDIACDSYHKYKEDVRLLKNLGVQFYRFSIAWSRVLPDGHINNVNQAGVDYYNNLIDECLANGIQPMVTLYHFNTPNKVGFSQIGSFSNAFIVDDFEDYCRLMFTLYGDRVKWWITINEPHSVATYYPRMINNTGWMEYMIAHNMILSHARAYHVYTNEFKECQRGKIGITLNMEWFEPLTDSAEDEEAAERSREFMFGWFANPILSQEGDYPPIMKTVIADVSERMGLSRSRLPEFTAQEINCIKGTFDFLGLNHYNTLMVSPGTAGLGNPSYDNDVNVTLSRADAPSVEGVTIVPWGFRKTLKWISEKYDNPPIFVTENGFKEPAVYNDTGRCYYHVEYIKEMLKAIYEDGCTVLGYAVWSIIDNFEWMLGYTQRFGLYYVDFEDPNRTRTAKLSVGVLEEIYKTRKIVEGCYNCHFN